MSQFDIAGGQRPPLQRSMIPLLASAFNVTNGGNEVVEIFLVLQARVIVNIITNLAFEDFLRSKWLLEKDLSFAKTPYIR
jgi:hypothetical protein